MSLSHSPLSAMTAGSSCLKRPISSSSWSTNVVSGRPLERLPYFGNQRSSWETISFLLLQKWPLNCSWHSWKPVENWSQVPIELFLFQTYVVLNYENILLATRENAPFSVSIVVEVAVFIVVTQRFPGRSVA